MGGVLTRVKNILSLFRTTLFSLFLLFPVYFILSHFHIKDQHKKRIALTQWARADYDLLSLNRALRILPLHAFQLPIPLSPAEIRLIQGWAIQGQVALEDLEKSRPHFSMLQREELGRLEKSFWIFRALLLDTTNSPFRPRTSDLKKPSASFMRLWSLERNLGLSMNVLSLTVRASRGDAERSLARLETKWEWINGGILFGFFAFLLGMDGWKLKRARETSFSKDAQLHAIFYAMRDAVISASPDRKIQYVNPAVEEIFGYPPSELIGQSAAVFYARIEDFEKNSARYNMNAGDDSEPYEMSYRRKDGSTFTGEARGAAVRDPNGQIQGFMVTVRDITQRKELRERLFLEKEKWFVTLGSIGDAVIVTDLGTRVEYLNSIAESLTGWTLAEAIGKPVREAFDIINENTRMPVESPVEKSLFTGTIVGLENHTVLRSRSGKEYAIEDSAAPIRSRNGQVIGCVVVFRDVTQKRNLLDQVTHQANHDALTSLPNRYLFQDRLVQMFTQARRLSQAVALIYLDIDHFKKINDSAGHPFGDLVLKEASRRIRSAVRESDTVARLGGDEFAIVAIGDLASADHAAHMAQKILDVMAQPFLIEDLELRLTASMGVAIFPEDGDDATTLIRNADIALYQAKEKGRNNIQFFSPIMNLTLQERTALENHLHDALERKEFELLYQPVVDLRQGGVVGVEALLRWHHPKRGLVPPDKFIPLAEDNGLILPLGEWVLETACRQARKWGDLGFPSLRVAVNVSTRQLTRGDFPGIVDRCLNATGLAPDCLELELTESVLLQKTARVVDALSALRTLGVRLSIDDFGTGYSSLGYLTRFQVNTLKIDGSFVQGIKTHPGNTAVIKAILALGQAMSMDIIAEGVETLDQVRFLKNHRCHLLQGYLLSHPVAAHEIPGILATNFRDAGGILSGL
jgi:diguanylate cyclase (GGDEF)-like protein/PAS domain S-box-containing protein